MNCTEGDDPSPSQLILYGDTPPVCIALEPAQVGELVPRLQRGAQELLLPAVGREVQPVRGLARGRLAALRVHAAHHYVVAV